jgi:hypothetical protein
MAKVKPETVLKAVRAAGYDKASEQGQRNAVQVALARYGYAKLPRIQSFTMEYGRVVRAYIWFDSPAGGDLILLTGGSTEPEIRLADPDEYVEATQRGVFVPAADASKKVTTQAEAGMKRAMGRVIGKDAAKPPPARKPKPKPRAKAKPKAPPVEPWVSAPSPARAPLGMEQRRQGGQRYPTEGEWMAPRPPAPEPPPAAPPASDDDAKMAQFAAILDKVLGGL